MTWESSARRQAGMIVGGIVGVLAEHPDGLSTKGIWEHLAQQQTTKSAYGGWKVTTESPFDLTFGSCAALIRAGWLRIDGRQWILSDEGRKAYQQYRDPHELLTEAGRRSTKGWLSITFPRSYALIGKFKYQITTEYRAARRLGVTQLLKAAVPGKKAGWQAALPVQTPRRITITPRSGARADSILDLIGAQNVPYDQGGHCIYLSPDALKRTALGALAGEYPANAGLKIMKTPGAVDGAGYVNHQTPVDSRLHLAFVHGHRHLTLVANLLYAEGLGPRLHDLIEIQCGNQVWTAYVMEHMNGGTPSTASYEAGIGQLRDLDKRGVLKVLPPEGFDDEEFNTPSCAGNGISDERGDFKYIDFQNFLLADYEPYLRRRALDATGGSHFGDKSILRGGSYLYQAVPGLRLSSKRDPEKRIVALKALMESCKLSVRDKLVLDVGCNIGMMMGQYLKLGAYWGHGWDRTYLTPHTEKLLLAMGCTRFSLTGGDIAESQPVEENLPAFLRSRLDGCVVSYLAIRGHVGWLEALGRIPWSFMIYEGHEGETEADYRRDIQQLKKLTNCDVRAVSEYIDGDSDPRIIAIIVRTAS